MGGYYYPTYAVLPAVQAPSEHRRLHDLLARLFWRAFRWPFWRPPGRLCRAARTFDDARLLGILDAKDEIGLMLMYELIGDADAPIRKRKPGHDYLLCAGLQHLLDVEARDLCPCSSRFFMMISSFLALELCRAAVRHARRPRGLPGGHGAYAARSAGSIIHW